MIADTFNVARCPEHGLHGERTECYVCRGEVQQVPVITLALHHKAMKEHAEYARLNAFEEVLSVCNDNDEADRKWSRGDFIKYMKYELGWNDRSGSPTNDAFPGALENQE